MTERRYSHPSRSHTFRNNGNGRTPSDLGCYRCCGCYGFSDPAPAEQEPDAEPVPLVYTVQEAADALRIGYSTMKEYLRSGEIPSFKLGSRRLVAGEDLTAWIRLQVTRGAA